MWSPSRRARSTGCAADDVSDAPRSGAARSGAVRCGPVRCGAVRLGAVRVTRPRTSRVPAVGAMLESTLREEVRRAACRRRRFRSQRGLHRPGPGAAALGARGARATSWTGCPARTAWCGTGSPPTTRRSSRSRTACGRSWRTSGSRFLGNVQVGGADGVPPARLRGAVPRGRLLRRAPPPTGSSASRARSCRGAGPPPGSSPGTAPTRTRPPTASRWARSAVVIGVGNVAVDVARILARGADELRATDMPQAALGALAGSRVRDVHMVGRRGPSQARFTTKELRELGALPGARVVVDPAELALDPAYAARRGCRCPRWCGGTWRCCAAGRRWESRGGRCRTPDPAAVLPAAGGAARSAAGGWRGCGSSGRRRTVPGACRAPVRTRTSRRSWCCGPSATGGCRCAGLPFDPVRGTVPHAAGRVLRDGVPSPGEYVAGWIKRGPTGVIGTNRPCAKETVASLLEDAPLLARAAGRGGSAGRAAGVGAAAGGVGRAGWRSSARRRSWGARWGGGR